MINTSYYHSLLKTYKYNFLKSLGRNLRLYFWRQNTHECITEFTDP